MSQITRITDSSKLLVRCFLDLLLMYKHDTCSTSTLLDVINISVISECICHKFTRLTVAVSRQIVRKTTILILSYFPRNRLEDIATSFYKLAMKSYSYERYSALSISFEAYVCFQISKLPFVLLLSRIPSDFCSISGKFLWQNSRCRK